MKITPLEIKRQQFKKVMRGYDPIEVDAFLDMLSHELEDVLARNKELKDKQIELETSLKDYKNMEKTLQQTLLQAQETSGKEIENSRRGATLIVQEAELKASQIVDKARMDFSRMKEEIANLKARKESILSRLKVLLSSEVDLIKALEIDDDTAQQDGLKGTGRDHIEIDDILKKL
jgi:cell division initiation protein